MQIDDRLVGLVLVVLGSAILATAQTFPLMAGMPYGPGFFPSIAATGLIVCGLVIATSGAVRARAADEGPSGPRPRLSQVMRGAFVRPAAIASTVVFFALALPLLGFHIAAVVTVAAAAFVFGARPVAALTLALAAGFGTHAVFYSMLRVPLPWGVMTPFAW